MDGTIELAPIRRGVSHQTDALQVVQCAAAMAIKHVTAAVHLGSVESNFPPVILPIAMEKNAVRSFQAGHGTVQAIMSPLWPPNTQPLTLARTPANVRQSRRTGCMDFQGLAGTGKTSSLDAIREGAERNGYAVQGFAPSSKAASQAARD